MRKNHNFSHTTTTTIRADYSTKTGNKLSLFWQPVSKNCHEKTGRRVVGHPEIRKLRTFKFGFLAYLLPA
jgi:hypothetical protein